MSVQLIQQYHAQVEKIIRYGGSRKESSVRKPFQDLLEAYARQRNLEMIAELDYRTRTGRTIYPDGTLKDALRQDWGYWESKDEADDLDAEIQNKFAKGYPCNNILFEDTQTAVLYQACQEVGRVNFRDTENLDRLLTQFVSYESREVREFREAIEAFTRDIPALGEMLRSAIGDQFEQNAKFQKAAKDFLELCQEAINPSMEMADVREMIVQHVLTEDIFVTVFDEPQFHRENIIAHELGQVVGTFYSGQVRRQIDARIEGYTLAIKARAAQIYNHQEKQKFLKVLYENFYKAYNPKAADRLGIVYTPNEIVRFMIEAADHLCFKHFGRTLGDPGVEILDPATGTGTFITEIIEYLPPHQLAHKYKHELHCNEVAILPYYIANLNIEYTYKQKMGAYEPFENIVFVDTLDNMGFKTGYVRQLGLFGLTDENSERIERQNKRDISVIIGNPPYNANQLNENENNKNREYPEIDRRIKDTYIKHSTARKTKLYDMYTRFFRWASDRLGDDGIIAFVTNNSFLEALGFDGFRRVVSDEFSAIYLVDLGGNLRKRESGNVFGIKVGVAISFLIRKTQQTQRCKIYYHKLSAEGSKEKLTELATIDINKIQFDNIVPSSKNLWLNIVKNDWQQLIPVATRDAKVSQSSFEHNAIFKQFGLGFSSNRDEWAVDVSNENLIDKMKYFVRIFKLQTDSENFDTRIKWSRNLKRRFAQGLREDFDKQKVRTTLYRPFCKLYFYDSELFVDERGAVRDFFDAGENLAIGFRYGSRVDYFATLATNLPPNLDMYVGASSQNLPLHRYDDLGNRVDNITDWALRQFQQQYAAAPRLVQSQRLDQSSNAAITKQDIFHYVYAVLHHPAYREKYKLNLKREFPRIPFYDDFWQWATWGQQLMQLHLNYETIEPYPLTRDDKDPNTTRTPYKARLKAIKGASSGTGDSPGRPYGSIEIDTLTTLSGIPAEAWDYQLGNRSALEWVLDRYKERTPKDPTIRDQFNTYRFRDYKEQVIDLLARVCTVSVQTMRIIQQMPEE
jgi:predicted helicase